MLMANTFDPFRLGYPHPSPQGGGNSLHCRRCQSPTLPTCFGVSAPEPLPPVGGLGWGVKSEQVKGIGHQHKFDPKGRLMKLGVLILIVLSLAACGAATTARETGQLFDKYGCLAR